MMYSGVDLSHWNGKVDFEKVRDIGYDFVILKCGGSDKGFYKDSKFEENYLNATSVGLNVGVYYFVGKKFITADDGLADAKRFAELIKGKKFTMPIYLDIESTPKTEKDGATEACIAFCDYLESLGYYVGIYGSDISTFKDRVNLSKLKAYDKWVARYGTSPKFVTEYGMWQKTSTGAVNGIRGNVDIDVAYKDYPKIIREHHLNNL